MHNESRLAHLLLFTNRGSLLIHFLPERALNCRVAVWDVPPFGGPVVYIGGTSRKGYTTTAERVGLKDLQGRSFI